MGSEGPGVVGLNTQVWGSEGPGVVGSEHPGVWGSEGPGVMGSEHPGVVGLRAQVQQETLVLSCIKWQLYSFSPQH